MELYHGQIETQSRVPELRQDASGRPTGQSSLPGSRTGDGIGYNFVHRRAENSRINAQRPRI
jgi:hypothetical protein